MWPKVFWRGARSASPSGGAVDPLDRAFLVGGAAPSLVAPPLAWPQPPRTASAGHMSGFGDESRRRFARIIGVSVVTTWALLSVPIASPAASADPCSDVAVVFARGTHQDPGWVTSARPLSTRSPRRLVVGPSGLRGQLPQRRRLPNSATSDPNDASAHIRTPWRPARTPRICLADILRARR